MEGTSKHIPGVHDTGARAKESGTAPRERRERAATPKRVCILGALWRLPTRRRGVPWSQLGAPRGGIYTYWRVFELAVWQLGLKGRQVCDRRAAGKTT